MILFADVQKRNQLRFNLLQFSSIFFIGIFQFLECARRVYIVARVDTYLLRIQGGHFGHMGIEMYIRNERGGISVLTQRSVDVLQILSLTHTLGGKSNVFATGIDDTFSLSHTPFGIIGRSEER